MTIYGVTGHRDVEQEPGELLAFARLSVALMRQHSGVVPTVITGVARGWDLKVARACHDLDVPYIAAVPFRGHEERWAPADKADYVSAMAHASRVEVISILPLTVSYIKRDKWIVDQSVELWALDSGRPSGSHTTVLYADQQGVIVRPLWEPWLRFRAERT